jgi:hypothetical protein
MYTVKFDGQFFADIDDNDDESYRIVSPVLSLKINDVGYFKFTVYPTHSFYDDLTEPKHIIEVFRDNRTEPLFVGRVASYEKGLYNELAVTCESEIAFLMDTVLTDFYSDTGHTGYYWLDRLLKLHNNYGNYQTYGSICTDNVGRKFEVGNVSGIYSSRILYPNADNFSGSYSVYEIIVRLIIEPLGGVIQFRHENGVNYIDLLEESDIPSQGLDITFGRNLLDIDRTVNVDEVVTAIRPFGASVKQGDDYVPRSIKLNDISQYITNSDIKQAIDPSKTAGTPLSFTDCMYSQQLVNKYGWIIREVTFDDATALRSLVQNAQKYLENSEARSGSSFRAMGVSESNMEYLPGTKITVNSQVHGISGSVLLITESELYLDDPERNTVTVGSSGDTITSQSGGGYSYSYSQSGASSSSGKYDPAGAADAAYERAKNYTDESLENFTVDSITAAQIDALFSEV